MPSKLAAWFHAFRLRTLPLAFSSIITGGGMALRNHPEVFSWLTFGLCLLTTLFLQVLSNLANDYGDSEKGTDNENRIGPARAVQAGLLSMKEIKTGIAINVLLCLASGIALLYYGFAGMELTWPLAFFALGLAAIAAAIKYTVGSNAYGYRGLGDVFVFIFFGLVGVTGSYILLGHSFDAAVLLPAAAIGAFSAAVLNLNNMRDANSDALSGKNTLVVKIGLTKAKQYHYALIIGAWLAVVLFSVLRFYSTFQFAYILTLPLFRKQIKEIRSITEPAQFDPLLKQTAIATFLFAMLFAAGYVMGE